MNERPALGLVLVCAMYALIGYAIYLETTNVTLCTPKQTEGDFIDAGCSRVRPEKVQPALTVVPSAFVWNEPDIARIKKHNTMLMRQGKEPPPGPYLLRED